MTEEFRKIKGFEDYQVSNLGNVKSFRTNKTHGKILRPGTSFYGYPVVNLMNREKKACGRLVHKLIQKAFELKQGVVDHIDGDTSNNNINNLRVITQRENCQNRVEHRNGKLIGATYMKKKQYSKKPWKSQMMIKGKVTYLGTYETELEAHEAYISKIKELGL